MTLAEAEAHVGAGGAECSEGGASALAAEEMAVVAAETAEVVAVEALGAEALAVPKEVAMVRVVAVVMLTSQLGAALRRCRR